MTDMRDNQPSDLLLLGGKIIAVFMQIAMAIGIGALVIGLGALLLYGSGALDVFSAEAEPLPFPLSLLIGILLVALAVVAMLFVFFGQLRAIISTVGEGDPFAPANADRLSLMGWLMLGVQLALIPAAALGIQLAQYADEMDEVKISIDGSLDLTGILLVIILFILARVFRHGAAMREDLEGTV